MNVEMVSQQDQSSWGTGRKSRTLCKPETHTVVCLNCILPDASMPTEMSRVTAVAQVLSVGMTPCLNLDGVYRRKHSIHFYWSQGWIFLGEINKNTSSYLFSVLKEVNPGTVCFLERASKRTQGWAAFFETRTVLVGALMPTFSPFTSYWSHISSGSTKDLLKCYWENITVFS